MKLCSALEGDGVGQVWEVMAEFRQKMEECGELEGRRRRQHLRWMWRYVEERLVRMARDIGHHTNIDNLENMVSQSAFLAIKYRERDGVLLRRLSYAMQTELKIRKNFFIMSLHSNISDT